MKEYKEKLQKLKESLRERGEITIALSGGVDSIFLTAFVAEVLKKNVKAVTCRSCNFAPDEIDYAIKFCREMNVEHEVFDIDVMDEIAENSRERCYCCKKKIFTQLKEKCRNIADGTNFDDLQDYRPGIKALEELGIWSPLKDAGLTKEEIRTELKQRNIEIWDKPAFACLASRVPYGEEITEEKLIAVYRVEKELKELGYTQMRARHHGEIVRIELLPSQWNVQDFEKIDAIGKKAGFRYVTLDMAGYIMGRMNG